jgi:hypothetical protein
MHIHLVDSQNLRKGTRLTGPVVAKAFVTRWLCLVNFASSSPLL